MLQFNRMHVTLSRIRPIRIEIKSFWQFSPSIYGAICPFSISSLPLSNIYPIKYCKGGSKKRSDLQPRFITRSLILFNAFLCRSFPISLESNNFDAIAANNGRKPNIKEYVSFFSSSNKRQSQNLEASRVRNCEFFMAFSFTVFPFCWLFLYSLYRQLQV